MRAAQLAGPGFVGPIQLVTGDREAARAVYTAARRVLQLASVTTPVPSRNGGAHFIQAVPAVDAQNDAGSASTTDALLVATRARAPKNRTPRSRHGVGEGAAGLRGDDGP